MEELISAEEQKKIEQLIRMLFDKLTIDGEFSLAPSQDMLSIVLHTEDTGIVIGYHGEVLEALQLILGLMIAKSLGRFVRINVEVGDYKKSREEYLRTLAQRMKERVLQEGKEQAISSLRPWERRIVHLFFQNDPEVLSESRGEGRERTLIIRPR
jgi:spoIIIJ-associated protein